jgi:hypothetical protein
MAGPKSKFGKWLRRAICIVGGGVAAAVAVFVYAITMKPITGTLEERVRMMAVGCPIAAVIGAGVGALIVFRAERLEAK